VSVPFPYDPDAPEPKRWNDFLDQLWPDEPDAIKVLGEWFGYVISGRTDLHKIFMMVGPTRGGKGVIARILTALLGKRNVCGPTLSSLGNEFGLAPLLGKSLAIISDARATATKGSSSVVVERLLSISGEDTLTVNRKYRDQWSGKLPVRLHVISNELPRLGDASSAIIGRLVLLLTTRSWLGKENHELEAGLHKELSGILNFALAGLRRLTIDNENRFTRFDSADEAITQMRDLASPVGAFVRERCVLDPNAEIPVDELYGSYKTWCQECEYPKSPKVHFGRDLRAACPSVRKTRPRNPSPDKRHYVYAGIRLRAESDDDDTGTDNSLFTRTTRTKSPAQPPPGPSGPSKNRNVGSSVDGPGRVTRERGTPIYRGKSDDMPYTGPVVDVPDMGADGVDEHGGPVAAQDNSPEPGSLDWHRKLAAWCDKWIAEGEDPNDLDDALRMMIREEIDDPSRVEVEFEKVKRLVRQENGAASVPFMITQEIKRRLRLCGYSDEQIAALTPQAAHEILARQGWRPDA
jgi:putative DNA primase/helicase